MKHFNFINYHFDSTDSIKGKSVMYPMMKDFIKYDHMFSSEYGVNHNHHLFSMSTSNDLSTGRKKRRKNSSKQKKSDFVKMTNKSINKKNSFIQKLTKKETLASQDTAATIGNMKRHFADHNYFGILFSKNNSIAKPRIKRVKGMSQVIGSKHLSSPARGLNLIKSMESSSKVNNQTNVTRSIESNKNTSFEYKPSLFRNASTAGYYSNMSKSKFLLTIGTNLTA